MKFFHALLAFVMHLGYFGPVFMGVLDSSFLVMPFGNDLLIVWLVAQRHGVAAWYVLAASVGSTLGALLVVLVSRKLGEAGIRKLAGKRYDSLCRRVSHQAWAAVSLGALAPPPFPYTLVIAAAGALGRPLPEILTANFFARAARFTVLALLAVKYGDRVTRIMQSAPFRWTMVGFVALCAVLSGISIWQWLRHSRSSEKPAQVAGAVS